MKLKTLTKLPEPSEAELQKAVLNLCEMHGYLVVRFNSGCMKVGKRFFRAYIIWNLKQSAGLPDAIVFRKGEFKMLEIKKPSEEPTEAQRRFALCAARFGITVHVVRSLDEARRLLENGERG